MDEGRQLEFGTFGHAHCKTHLSFICRQYTISESSFHYEALQTCEHRIHYSVM